VRSLPLFHRLAGQPVIVAGAGEAAEAKRRLVERAGGRIVGPDNPNARLAFLALAAPEALAVELKARGVLVNVVDRPELCDFTTPALVDRDPVLIAVGTGGAAAGLAKAIRLRLEALLPESLGALADALSDLRVALRARWPDPAARRGALDAALGEGGPLDPLADHDAGAVHRWLNNSASAAASCHEFAVTGEDPDDLTLRQSRWLGRADLVAYEPGVAQGILPRARADAGRRQIGHGKAAPAHAGQVVIIRRKG
jgi:uroporphyrin-III C-methyltransferase/precorrin-2 dehydrogenase/sirohydrochlorin ferrochelatase